MIDRKALWITAVIFFAMIAATVWRLSLLPDWTQFPFNGPGDARSRESFWLFVSPACLVFVAACLFARKWVATGPEENVRPWRKWSGMILLPYAAIIALMQAFVLARSLGFAASLDRIAVVRGMLVLMGVLLMVLGNVTPKLPWLSVRFRPLQLDPWQWNRQLRFVGRMLVGIGAFVAIGGVLLPTGTFFPALIGLWLVTMAAGIWHRIKLRREPSPQP